MAVRVANNSLRCAGFSRRVSRKEELGWYERESCEYGVNA